MIASAQWLQGLHGLPLYDQLTIWLSFAGAIYAAIMFWTASRAEPIDAISSRFHFHGILCTFIVLVYALFVAGPWNFAQWYTAGRFINPAIIFVQWFIVMPAWARWRLANTVANTPKSADQLVKLVNTELSRLEHNEAVADEEASPSHNTDKL